MTWPLAIFLCFSSLIFWTFLLLLIIYIKEFGREKEIIKDNKSKKDTPIFFYDIELPADLKPEVKTVSKKVNKPPKKDIN